MREILFRGKRRDNGKWIEGSLAASNGLINIGRAYILPSFTNLYSERDSKARIGNFIEVDPETVGQYTGLCDKNGKKIFEGDIVKSVFSGKFYPVCFGEYTYVNECGDEEGACGWYNEEEHGYLTAFAYSGNWAIVVGNIHDNLELLEVDNG